MISHEEYKNKLLTFDLQSFLEKYKGSAVLNLKNKFPSMYKILSEQIKNYPKAFKKMPIFTANYCYLTSKSYEQSSGEALAKYKSMLINGNILIDLTAGLGIDDIAFSKNFKKVISVDPDQELNLLSEINFSKLGISNIQRFTSKADEYIKNDFKADIIYIDPDRRISNNENRAVTLHNSSPDILLLLNRLFEISSVILLKLSPLIDIKYIKNKLKNIQWIRVVSLAGEVKEILVLLNSLYSGKTNIIAVDVKPTGRYTEYLHTGKYKSSSINNIYFIAAGAAIIKAGVLNEYGKENGFCRLNKTSPYFTADKLPAKLIGRAFRILHFDEFSKSVFRKYISERELFKANISCKGFYTKPDDIKKIFGLKDGGSEYFFFILTDRKEKMFYHCHTINNEE